MCAGRLLPVVVWKLLVIFDLVPVVMQRLVPTIQTVQKTVEVIQLVPQERIQERIAEQVVDIPLPQIMEEMMEVVLFIPRTRQNRTVEQIVDVSIPQIQEETSPKQKYLAKSLCLAWLCWC